MKGEIGHGLKTGIYVRFRKRESRSGFENVYSGDVLKMG